MAFNPGDIPIIGGMLGDTKADKAGKEKLRRMDEAGRHYAYYRPIAFQQRQNALRNQMAALGPMNNALGQMYGPSAQLDMNQILANPVETQRLYPGFEENQRLDAQEGDAKRRELISGYNSWFDKNIPEGATTGADLANHQQNEMAAGWNRAMGSNVPYQVGGNGQFKIGGRLRGEMQKKTAAKAGR